METKPIVDKINTNVSLSKKTHAAITKKAKELGITNSRLINTLCINGLAKVKTDTVGHEAL